MFYSQGEWFSPMIANTGCQVKWNPDFFEDKEPFKMTQVRFSFRSISMLRNSLVGLSWGWPGAQCRTASTLTSCWSWTASTLTTCSRQGSFWSHWCLRQFIAMATFYNHFIYQADSGLQQHGTVVVCNRCVNVCSRQGSDISNLKTKERGQLLHSSLWSMPWMLDNCQEDPFLSSPSSLWISLVLVSQVWTL